ncbi:MAG: ATP-binding cassette domain-containing protein [Intrasporangium sp.]|uniref:ATP-binding cassette domain-containing protein n=1 Tax=Intrasporangium sp. TaxID=1925024 RepID=UPI00264A318E|nr:ATP-binding cassette domain-containing protein [Intrasporangium sp.]MDN5798313.1 ATP-binding cassette domain-containing protein [Intrasporangium sp.]
MPEPVIRTAGLVKVFGRGERQVRALDGIDLQVELGAVTCLLGHNGSGKTTLVRILTTRTRPTEGLAMVAGHDVVAEPDAVRRALAVTAQETTLDARLSGRENLGVLARLWGLAPRAAARRADQLLEEYDLAEAAARPVSTWSGGMRRRLDLAASLIGSPHLLVLDEPTTGLDPESRTTIWRSIEALARDGTSVLLTTQYLDEADRLADHAVVLRQGRVVADESPTRLKRRIGRRLVLQGVGAGLDRVQAALAPVGVTEVAEPASAPEAAGADVTGRDGSRFIARVLDDRLTLPVLLDALNGSGLTVSDIGLQEPTLDEAYLALMGEQHD